MASSTVKAVRSGSTGHDDRSVVIRRKLCAILAKEGFKIAELSAAFKVSERTVWNYIRNVNDPDTYATKR